MLAPERSDAARLGGLKLCIAGKGGVGKTTVTALLADRLAASGHRVIAVDADPVAHLGGALGLDAEARRRVQPIAHMRTLIAERAGSTEGSLFMLNPRIDDLLGRFGVLARPGVTLLQLGGLRPAGSGCFCPENALLRALLRQIVLEERDVVLMDMEAGIEHLSRSTTERMDLVLTVVEPGRRSIETAGQIRALASQLGVRRVGAVANKTRSPTELDAIQEGLDGVGIPLLAELPYDEGLARGELRGLSVPESIGSSGLLEQAQRLVEAIERGQEEAQRG